MHSMKSMDVPIKFCKALLMLSLRGLGSAAQTNQTGARWIPTDLNYGVLTNLRENALQSPADQIAGYSTLGIIPSDVVGAWLQQLISNTGFATGTVRWNPSTALRCTSGTSSCTKSVQITVLEFDYISPNGSDCNASALIAANALLPPQAVFSSNSLTYMPTGPIQYQIIRSPNSTANNCTYVVQYPPATQTLAQQLCSQLQSTGPSCFNSTCVPCNANQSFATPANPSGCTAASGIAPSLVAAIEGAAQCLSQGGQGAFQCQVAYIANASACSMMHCFPGDGEVLLEGGNLKQMQDLQIGDRVQVVAPDGLLGFDDIYFFGHRSKAAMGSFIRLVLQPRPTLGSPGSEKVLELSRKHFLPVGKKGALAYKQAEMLRAGDVRLGDAVWVQHTTGLSPYYVEEISGVQKAGLWAPYTRQGTIVVNGVVASVHSEWILDDLLDVFGRADLLPAIYQVLLGPLWVLYRLLGPYIIQQLDNTFDFGSILTSPPFSSDVASLS